MVFEQRKQLDGRGLFGSIMFLQIQLEIAVIILLPLWESVEASTTYIKACTVLQSSLTVCLNLVSLCWDSSSASSASSTSTNSLLNLGLPSRAFASLSFLKWLFTREQIISKSFVLVYNTICKTWKWPGGWSQVVYHSYSGLIMPLHKCVITRKGEIMSVIMSVICDHSVIIKYFYWGSTGD